MLTINFILLIEVILSECKLKSVY